MTSMLLDVSSRLRFLNGSIVAELNRMLLRPGTSIMPHVLSIQLGIDYAGGLAIITILTSEGLCDTRILIYHSCEPDLTVGEIELRLGLPALPWRCPNCERFVESYSELRFDVEAVTLDTVEVI